MSTVVRSASDSGHSRLNVAFAAAALIAILLLGLIYWLKGVYVEREFRHRHQAERELQSINQLQLRALNAWRQDALRDAGMLVEDGLLGGALARWRNAADETARIRVSERLRALKELRHYTAVYFVDVEGKVHLSALGEASGRGVDRVPEDYAGFLREALVSALPVMSRPVARQVFAFPSIGVFAPMFDEERLIGAVWLVQDLRVGLIPLVEPWPTPSQTARSSIVWRDGELARYLNAPRDAGSDVLSYAYPLDAGNTAAVQALEGMRGVFYARDEFERAVMAVASPIFGTDWVLVSAVEVAEVFADVRRRELLALTLPVSLLLLFFAGVMGFVLRRAWQRERELTQALQRSLGGLEAELRVDPLTGVANRRAIDESARFQLALAVRGGTPMSVLMIDVDHFKYFNDHYGHPAGDQCLKNVAAAFQAHVRRAGELVGRYGGEEFAVLLPLSDAKAARVMAQSMCDAVRDLRIPHAGSAGVPWVTISVGVACVRYEDVALDLEEHERPGAPADWRLLRDLFERADVALYEAKRQGRDRVVLYEDLIDSVVS